MSGVRHIREVLVAGDVRADFLPFGIPARFFSVPGTCLDDRGRIPVSAVISWTQSLRSCHAPIAVFTDRELSLPGCDRLFGFADVETEVAVISSHGLSSRDDPTRLGQRMGNIFEHESAHLSGFGHCRNRRCVMRPVREAAELDSRSPFICERCISGRAGKGGFQWLRT